MPSIRGISLPPSEGRFNNTDRIAGYYINRQSMAADIEIFYLRFLRFKQRFCQKGCAHGYVRVDR